MYALPTLEKNLDKQFLDAFVKKEVIDEEIQMDELIKEWLVDNSNLKIRAKGLYPTNILKEPVMIVASLLYRLFGEPNALRFKLEWVPLIHRVINKGTINWVVILSKNLKK